MPAIPTLVRLVDTGRIAVVFSEAIERDDNLLPWDDGFTVTVNTVPVAIASAAYAFGGLTLELDVPFDPEVDVVEVVYAGANLLTVSSSLPVAPFTETAVPPLVAPHVTSVTVLRATPNVIELVFREPVTTLDGDLLGGFGLTINGAGVSLLTATATQSQQLTVLTIQTDVAISYNATVVLSYSGGIGDLVFPLSDIEVGAFTITAENLSTVGWPEDGSPLSTILLYKLRAVSKSVVADIGVNLNIVDRELVKQFGPVTVDVGGYFGQPTVLPPDGYFVPGRLVELTDGITISQSFNVPNDTPGAAVAAADWQNAVLARVQVALGRMRLTNSNTDLQITTIHSA